jgi:hypothetical protein
MKRWASNHFWTRNPVEESSDDNDEHEEVFTLGRMSTRSQTRVSRYFTHVEVEADIEEELLRSVRKVPGIILILLMMKSLCTMRLMMGSLMKTQEETRTWRSRTCDLYF